MPHYTVVVDVKAMSQLLQNGHVAIRNEGVATRELGEVVVVVPVERGDLQKAARVEGEGRGGREEGGEMVKLKKTNSLR